MSIPTQLIRDGFQVVAKDFALPENTPFLEPRKKRPLTICNLFFNHHLPIGEIARVLDEEHATVIGTLIEHQLIKDRRQKWGMMPPAGVERRWIKSQRSPA
jgi:hypothetical protein